jgi:hypothetical protein
LKKYLALAITFFVIAFTGLIGIQTATAAETWYSGEGLKEGDYFRYNLCHFDYKKCAQFEMDFWVEGKTETGDWNLEVLVIDGAKEIRGNMIIGRVAPEPLGGSDNLAQYRGAYKSSIVWLSSFANRIEPKDFASPAWGKIGNIGGQPVGPFPNPGTKETVIVPAGSFETYVIGFHKSTDSKIWVKDDFPFPIKALAFVDVTTGTIPTEYEFELLEYGNTANPPDFLERGTEHTATEDECPKDDTFVESTSNLNTGKMVIYYRYAPEHPKPGCQVQWNLEFGKWFDPTQFESDVHYDIFVVDKNDNRLRSLANDEGRTHLFTPDGKSLLFMDVKEPTGKAQYVIWVYGTGPNGAAPDAETSGILRVDLEIGEGEVPIDETPIDETPIDETPIDETPIETPQPKPKTNQCAIATAAFGSELAPQVQILRETRDNIVMQTQSGAAFMTAFNTVYYSFAPTVADWERENPVFKEIVKATITPLITTLSILNYADIDSEAEMLTYGIGVILLNVGMYFVAPAFVIMRFTKNNK